MYFKSLLSGVFLLICSALAMAQSDSTKADSVRYWTASSTLSFNFSQSSLTNWVGGGQNSLNITSLSSSFLNYSRGRVSWNNSLDMGYGLTRLGKDTAPFRKTEDKFIFISKFGLQHTKTLRYTFMTDFRTQFSPGYKYSTDSLKRERIDYISNFLAPGYLITAAGLEYSPVKPLSILFSPVTMKMTIVKDRTLSNAGAYGVRKGETIRTEFGAYLTAQLKLPLMENITLSSNLNLFGNYKNLKAIDILWDNTLIMKVNKLINISISTNLIYDNDIKITRESGSVGPAIQFKEVLAVGVTAKLK